MQITLALAALATSVYAQSCSSDYDGTFQLGSNNLTQPNAKRDLVKRACSADGHLTSTLKGGVLTDDQNRVGEITSNFQFQYDPQPQPGSKASNGFGVCDGNLALNGNTEFIQCFDNERTSLYSPEYADAGDNCYKVHLPIVACNGAVTQGSDGQPGVTPTCVPVTEMVDGQPVVTPCPTTTSSTCVPISQIVDGQLQYSPCPTTTSECVAVSQIVDGQLQVSTCPTTTSACVAVSQIVDGQLQVSTCPGSSATGTGVPAATASNTFLTAGVNAGNALSVGSQAAVAIFALVAVAFL